MEGFQLQKHKNTSVSTSASNKFSQKGWSDAANVFSQDDIVQNKTGTAMQRVPPNITKESSTSVTSCTDEGNLLQESHPEKEATSNSRRFTYKTTSSFKELTSKIASSFKELTNNEPASSSGEITNKAISSSTNFTTTVPSCSSRQLNSKVASNSIEPISSDAKLSSTDDAQNWKGIPISRMNRTPDCSPVLPTLEATAQHTVMFHLPIESSSHPPLPFPSEPRDKWDDRHVRMPCSPDNLYPQESEHGKKKLQRRWELIQQALVRNIHSSLDVEEIILMYNTRYAKKWSFCGFHSFFTEYLSRTDADNYLRNVLPKLAKLALQLPRLCTQPIPLLKQGMNHSITLTQQQVACLLANAFFCTFPRRNAREKKSEYSTFPSVNFSGLFGGARPGRRDCMNEKLRTLFHYFERITNSMPTGVITFERRCIPEDRLPDWMCCTTLLPKFHVASQGIIEDNGTGMLQVDFANKFVGGGCLGQGMVQEEIRFLICPEMIVSRLFTEALARNEVLVLTGCERFSSYSGYGDTYTWAGDYCDQVQRDAWFRLQTEVVAMDALHFRTRTYQYQLSPVLRELNKAYVGFYSSVGPPFTAVATGNWGCGAFKGDPYLKSLLQLLAAAEAGRDVVYFTFGDEDLRDKLYEAYTILSELRLSAADILPLIEQYYIRYCACESLEDGRPQLNLVSYILKVYCDGDFDNENEESFDNEAATP